MRTRPGAVETPSEGARTASSAPHSFAPIDPNGASAEANGHSAPMRATLEHCLDALYRYIYARVGGHAHDAEDLLQQTAAIALDSPTSPPTDNEREFWLRGIARNLIRAHWRRCGRQTLTSPEAAKALLARFETPRSARTPHQKALTKEEMNQLLHAISALGGDDQKLLYDFYRCNKSHADIALETGVSVKTVEGRLYRMRARLREQLASEGDTDGRLL